MVVPHAPIYHILLGWNNIFNSYWRYNEKLIDWIWLCWIGQYLACEPTIFPVQCDQTQSINTLYIGYNSQGTQSDIFHFTCNYRCILQRLYWCCTVAGGSDHVLIQIICFWELPPLFQLCFVILEKGRDYLLRKGLVSNLFKENYRVYDDSFIFLTSIFKYPIMVWKNFVSKRTANIGDLVICQIIMTLPWI